MWTLKTSSKDFEDEQVPKKSKTILKDPLDTSLINCPLFREKIIASIDNFSIKFQQIKSENLLLEYSTLFQPLVCAELLAALEQELEYFTGDLARVRVFGKWHNIPRKQVKWILS